MLTITLALAIATSGTQPAPAHCDRLELNQVLDWCGDHWHPRLLQWIAWDWDARRRCWIVRDWAICRTDARPTRHGPGWLLTVYRDGRLFQLYADTYSTTWTLHDPEVANRDVVPQSKRRALQW